MTRKAKTMKNLEERAELAFVLQADDRASLDAERLVHINVDVALAVENTLRILPRLFDFVPDLVAALTRFDPLHFRYLEQRTLALRHAHRLYQRELAVPRNEPAFLEAAFRMRGLLHDTAKLLVTRGHLREEQLLVVQRTTGYAALVQDLAQLVVLFLDDWERLGPVCGLALTELYAASELSTAVSSWSAERKRVPARVTRASLERQRAYTLFFRCYEQARAGLTYVLRESGDVDDVMPSLFAGRIANRSRRLSLRSCDGDAELLSSGRG